MNIIDMVRCSLYCAFSSTIILLSCGNSDTNIPLLESNLEKGGTEDVDINEKNFPDWNFRNWVMAQEYGKDGLLTEKELAEVTCVNVVNQNISDLKGIGFFTALTSLDCSMNLLSSLDISNNRDLTSLSCSYNSLKVIDTTENIKLKTLSCSKNQIGYIDLSNNTALTVLDCQANKLVSLDLIHNVELQYLYCSQNKLSKLDVSKNIALKVLDCKNNALTCIDIPCEKMLTTLYCSNNNLLSLDVSGCSALIYLFCSNNYLSYLDVSYNMQLKDVAIDKNQICGASMNQFIMSLPPTNKGYIEVDFANGEKENTITVEQVANAMTKGWIIRFFDGIDWKEYQHIDNDNIS